MIAKAATTRYFVSHETAIRVYELYISNGIPQ